MDSILNQSRPERLKESLAASFISTPSKEALINFLLAPSDHGVQRNGGRAGARWAPQALLTPFKKLALPQQFSGKIASVSVTELAGEHANYEQMLEREAQLIAENLNATVVHLGGGHDHVLPLLKALGDVPVSVLNVDAHLDTRMDPEAHSGNPFRQYADHSKFPLQLHQIGIHPYANTLSTRSALKHGEMHVLMRRECDDEARVHAFLLRLETQLAKNAKVVFSLDCDALMASDVEAVSAPNHDGLSLAFVRRLALHYRDLCQRRGQQPIWGFYEFNPLYDSVSGRGARAVAGLIYDILF